MVNSRKNVFDLLAVPGSRVESRAGLLSPAPDMNLPWSTAVTLLHSLPGTHVVASDYQVDSCSITALVCR